MNFNLDNNLLDNDNLIKYILEDIQTIKNFMHNSEEKAKNEKKKQESEIKELKENIKQLKENNSKLELRYKNEISDLKQENEKLWEQINKFKNFIENPNKIEKEQSFDSVIVQPLNSIDFILKYIKENDGSCKCNNIKLLYRGSRDGDRTKTCHKLCDNKTNILIIMQSDNRYIFGGYSKIGFKTQNKQDDWEYKIDNNCFLFSLNLKKYILY